MNALVAVARRIGLEKLDPADSIRQLKPFTFDGVHFKHVDGTSDDDGDFDADDPSHEERLESEGLEPWQIMFFKVKGDDQFQGMIRVCGFSRWLVNITDNLDVLSHSIARAKTLAPLIREMLNHESMNIAGLAFKREKNLLRYHYKTYSITAHPLHTESKALVVDLTDGQGRRLFRIDFNGNFSKLVEVLSKQVSKLNLGSTKERARARNVELKFGQAIERRFYGAVNDNDYEKCKREIATVLKKYGFKA